MNSLCSCSLQIEDTLHYLLHCHHFNHICTDLMNNVKSVIDNFESLSEKDKKDILLYGDSRLDRTKNKSISEASLTYIKNSENFCRSLLNENLTPWIYNKKIIKTDTKNIIKIKFSNRFQNESWRVDNFFLWLF